jgi:hypothetical protein
MQGAYKLQVFSKENISDLLLTLNAGAGRGHTQEELPDNSRQHEGKPFRSN